MTKEQGIKHENCRCNYCAQDNFGGLRLKCDICQDYDLCFKCYSKQKHPDHPFVVMFQKSTNELPIDDIEFIEELGHGSFGRVYKAKAKSLGDKIVACKTLDPTAIGATAYLSN